MNTLTWLHISDLHFRASQAYNADVVLRKLLQDIAGRVQEDNLHPDFIAVTGDIAFSGQPDEYARAQCFFDDLLAQTGLPGERLFVVPGNHDVNRKLITFGAKVIGTALADRDKVHTFFVTPSDRQLVFARFTGYAEFVNGYLTNHLVFDDEHHFYVRILDLAERKVALLGLDSAWLCASGWDKKKGLLIGDYQVRTALEQAERADLKIALLHHPFDWLREFDQNDSAFMLMDGCDFILHGHLHSNMATRLISPDNTAMIVACGACYEARKFPNMYNWIRLDWETNVGTVYLRRYSDNRGGFWTKDVSTYKNVSDGRYEFPLHGKLAGPSTLTGDSARKDLSVELHSQTAILGQVGEPQIPQERDRSDRLSIRCPVCQTELPNQAHFCFICGKQLTATLAVSPGRPVIAAKQQELPKLLADHRLDYLNALIGDSNRLRLSGLDPTASDPTRVRPMTLDQVYVGLDTRMMRDKRERSEGPAERTRLLAECERKPLSTLEAISRAPRGRLVLLGQPGSGKSTLARYLALRLAQALASDDPRAFDFERYLPGWERGALLPVVIALGRLAQNIPVEANVGTADIVLDYMRGDAFNCYDCGEWVADELERAEGLVIFDGLDEVPAEKRVRVQQAVRQFADQHPACVCVVTCRTFSYTRDPGWQLGDDWPACELASFDQDKISDFITAWYNALTCLDEAKKAAYEDKASKLRAALSPSDARQLFQLAGVPLLLTVMAAVHTHEDELPGGRALIYEKCVGLLLERWASERTAGAEPVPLLKKLDLPDRILLDKALWEAAFRAHESGEWRQAAEGSQPALVTEGLLKEVTECWLGAVRAATFIEYCQTSNGLLMASSKTRLPDSPPDAPLVTLYTFPHLTFEEFLAARYLQSFPDMPDRAAQLAADVRWREVILFLIEYLCATGCDWQASMVLERLCTKDEPRDDAAWRAIWVAGEGLLALRRVTAADMLDIYLDRRIVHRLTMLLAEGRLSTQDRAAASRTLALLGDPRPGVGVVPLDPYPNMSLPDILWATLPAGTLRMGSRRCEMFQTPLGKQGPSEDEYWPARRTALRAIPIKSFKLATYPVTVAQFRPFVENPGGWANDEWWTKSGLKDRGDDKAPYLWDEQQQWTDNHPVVGITWYAAVAYCHWLTAWLRISGVPQFKNALVRLPTEAEWEWAARGPLSSSLSKRRIEKGHRWTWGNDWRADACNSSESQIGRTCAVGMFPAGVNWTGNVYDLAGNVWEWCSTKWQEYGKDYSARRDVDEWTDNYLTGIDHRVIRGGSFDNDARVVRGAFRFRPAPHLWGPGSGFRCALCLSE